MHPCFQVNLCNFYKIETGYRSPSYTLHYCAQLIKNFSSKEEQVQTHSIEIVIYILWTQELKYTRSIKTTTLKWQEIHPFSPNLSISILFLLTKWDKWTQSRPRYINNQQYDKIFINFLMASCTSLMVLFGPNDHQHGSWGSSNPMNTAITHRQILENKQFPISWSFIYNTFNKQF